MHENTDTASFRSVDVAEARRMAAQGALLLDVREPLEWAAGHIDGARHVPLGRLSPQEVPGDRCVITVCRSGNRSKVAAELLVTAGHPDVVDMSGGVLAWEAAGFPLSTGAGERADR